MLKWWKRGLALSLGLLVSSAHAGDDGWNVPASKGGEKAASANDTASAPTVTLGRPVTVGQASTGPRAGAVLGTPIPVGSGQTNGQATVPIHDSQVRPTNFQSDWSTAAQIRGQNPDPDSVRPTSTGSSSGRPNTISPLYSWKQDQDEIAPPPRMETAPPPVPGGPLQGGPIQGGPVQGGSLGEFPQGDGQMYPGMPDGYNPGMPDGYNPGMPDGYNAFAAPATPVVQGGQSLSPTGCFPGNELYISGEGLFWWVKSTTVPALGTTYPDTAAIPRGVFGGQGSQVVLGQNAPGNDTGRGGGRVMVGYWFDDQHYNGLEVGGFYLGQFNKTYGINSFGATNLAVPLLLFPPGTPGALPIAGINGTGIRDVGSLQLNYQSTFAGGEANWRTNIVSGPYGFIDGIIGFRQTTLDEQLEFDTVTSGHGLTMLLGRGTIPRLSTTERNTSDLFKTQNGFYGGQIGAIGEWTLGRWVFDLNAKVALGSTQEMITINGGTIDHTILATGAATTASYPVGLLAGASNSGRFTRDQLSFIPEAGLKVGYQVTQRLKVFVGYNFMYWSNVVQPGDQINRNVTLSQLPGFATGVTPGLGTPPQPNFAFHTTDFWAQGITAGLEWRF